MRPSRGMGAIMPSKMGKKKTIIRKDDPNEVTMYKKGGEVKMAGGGLYANIAAKRARGEPMRKAGAAGAPKKSDFANAAKTAKYAEGGETKSKVNEAGNYTKPEMRKRIFNSIKAAAVQGTGSGKWSARKSQLLAKRYKAAGGSYR